MRKLLLPLIIMLLVLAACGNQGEKNNKAETKPYKMDDGRTVDISKNPRHAAVAAPTYAGGLKELGANIVAVNQQVDWSEVLKDKFKGITKIGDSDIKKVVEEKPDLIIVYSTDKDVKKHQKVAPTVAVDYNKHKYLEQQEMLGKVVGKEDKVKAWKKNWEETTVKDSREIKKAIGQDTTVLLFDEFNKKLYIYGDNWGRGGKVSYQAFGLKIQLGQQKLAAKAGWAGVKQEEIEKYAGDYIVSTSEGKPTSGYESTNMWKDLKATKEGHIVKADAGTYWYDDPCTLDFMRKNLKGKLVKAAK